KEVVELLGEPESKNTDKDNKVKNAKWISGKKSLTVIFENDVVQSVMSHGIPVRTIPTLTNDNVKKIKVGTTTYKEVVELFGEPTATNTTKEGKLRKAIWNSGLSNVDIGFDEDGVVKFVDVRLEQVRLR